MPVSKPVSRTLSCAALMLAAALALLMAGCAATGTPATQMQHELAAVPASMGRIVFYRDSSIVGAAVQPSILLDGAMVGESKPGGFFFSDVAPGTHEVSARTEVVTTLSVTVGEGQTRYVRSAITMGLLVGRVQFTLVHEDEARMQMPLLRFTGAPVTASSTRAGVPPRPASPPPGAMPPRAAAATVSLDDLDALLPKKP